MVRSLGRPKSDGDFTERFSQSSASAEVLEFTGDEGSLEGMNFRRFNSPLCASEALEMEPPPTTAPPEERQR